MQEVLAASGQTQQVSFLQRRNQKPEELEFMRTAEGVRVPRFCQALQAQRRFILASTCRVAIGPILVCHGLWILVGGLAPLSTFGQAATVPVREGGPL